MPHRQYLSATAQRWGSTWGTTQDRTEALAKPNLSLSHLTPQHQEHACPGTDPKAIQREIGAHEGRMPGQPLAVCSHRKVNNVVYETLTRIFFQMGEVGTGMVRASAWS